MQGLAAGIQLSAFNLLLLTHPQLIQEFRLALWLGRTLALPSDEPCSCKRHVEYKDATGRIQQLQVINRRCSAWLSSWVLHSLSELS
jgi:hypothetical protein